MLPYIVYIYTVSVCMCARAFIAKKKQANAQPTATILALTVKKPLPNQPPVVKQGASRHADLLADLS